MVEVMKGAGRRAKEMAMVLKQLLMVNDMRVYGMIMFFMVK